MAHDLAVVKNISDRVAVMYLGKLCEVAEANSLYENPAHPYTSLLVGSSPIPDPLVEIDESMVEEGELPSPIDPPRAAGSVPAVREPMTFCVAR